MGDLSASASKKSEEEASERATVCRTISGGPPWPSLSSFPLAVVASSAPVPFAEAHHWPSSLTAYCTSEFFGAFLTNIAASIVLRPA